VARFGFASVDKTFDIEYWWESQKVRYHWDDQDVGERTILKWIVERQDGMVRSGLNLLWIGTSGGLV
jgi:hypothetical protein